MERHFQQTIYRTAETPWRRAGSGQKFSSQQHATSDSCSWPGNPPSQGKREGGAQPAPLGFCPREDAAAPTGFESSAGSWRVTGHPFSSMKGGHLSSLPCPQPFARLSLPRWSSNLLLSGGLVQGQGRSQGREGIPRTLWL